MQCSDFVRAEARAGGQRHVERGDCSTRRGPGIRPGPKGPEPNTARRPGPGGQDAVLGCCSSAGMRVCLRDEDQFRGRSRVRVDATHARMEAAELKTITGCLDAIGRRLDSIEVRSTSNLASTGAYACLYDLSDRDRLRASSSESHPVPASPADEDFAPPLRALAVDGL